MNIHKDGIFELADIFLSYSGAFSVLPKQKLPFIVSKQ